MASGRHRSSLVSPGMFSLADYVSVDTVRVVVSKVFKHRFTRVGSLHINELNVEFHSLDTSSGISLESLFTEEEIVSTFRDVDGEKL